MVALSCWRPFQETRSRCRRLGKTAQRAISGAIVAAATLVAAAPEAQTETPSYADFHSGKFLRYLNAGNGGISEVPRIGLAFGERTLHAVIDSGSTGIVVAATYIPNFDALPSVGDGRLTYTSSGRVLTHG